MSALLEVRELTVVFPGRGEGAPVTAVDRVSLQVARGETLGVVGESGAGKTTLGRAVLRLVEARAGVVLFEGADVLAMEGRELKAFRRRAQIVFQDPMGSLHPRLRVGAALEEVLGVHGTPRAQRRSGALALLERVGLPAEVHGAFPHELSGGQRQRVGIARALAVEPELVVLDEPVSALDVSVQAQIVNLLLRLQRELALTYLFISHDLALVHRVSDRILVMKDGAEVESGTPDAVLQQSRHPYTRTLIDASLLGPSRG